MNKWKLRKLEINSFKVFENFSESFDSDLTVLDGPNGFGKTSIFDAIELLFCASIPRITSLYNSIKGNKTQQYTRNLYWNNKSDSEITIKAELYLDDRVIYLMRKATLIDLENKNNNKPLCFEIFKLYQITNFSSDESETLITDEKAFISDIFGEHFLNNFSILNYISQDNNSVIIPDISTGKRSRFDQISHLLKLDKVMGKLSSLSELEKKRKARIKILAIKSKEIKQQVLTLKEAIQGSEEISSYKKLTKVSSTPKWDQEKPIVSTSKEDYKNLQDELELLMDVVVQVSEVELIINNNKFNELVSKKEFSTAVHIGLHLDKYETLSGQKIIIDSYVSQMKTLKFSEAKISLSNVKSLVSVSDTLRDKIKQLVEKRESLKEVIDGYIANLSEIQQLRNSIVEKQNTHESVCMLCGFDYKENQILLDSIALKSDEITKTIKDNNDSYQKCLELLKKSLILEYTNLESKSVNLKVNFSSFLLEELESNNTKKVNLALIAKQLAGYNIPLDQEYSSDEEVRNNRLFEIKNKILSLKKEESNTLKNGAIEIFNQCFTSIDELQKITVKDLEDKKKYINNQFNFKINAELKSKENELEKNEKSEGNLVELGVNLSNIIDQINKVKNTYSSQTIGQVESLFHIYSGRLIQNYQRGLGLFIDTEEDSNKKKGKNLCFFTADGTKYDAILSMCSGQIAALTLAFFLSLNRKYANTAFIFIDDPTQCMDEINIASLSDLLRIELRDRQVIISTHEQEVSDYLRYRYLRGGLKANSIHLQNKIVENSVN
ncbi:MAG: AAA family ATPase [Saccharospirillaceae bacterium]|nr:AAA family ATPase [Saccharospirillaceae bacterium]